MSRVIRYITFHENSDIILGALRYEGCSERYIKHVSGLYASMDSNPRSIFLGAYENHNPRGFMLGGSFESFEDSLLLVRDPDFGSGTCVYLSYAFVFPPYRREGVFSDLFDCFLERAKHMEYEKLKTHAKTSYDLDRFLRNRGAVSLGRVDDWWMGEVFEKMELSLT